MPGLMYFCDHCEQGDAEARERYASRADAANMDAEIRAGLNGLYALLMSGAATWSTIEAGVIDALNAERRIILRQMVEAQDVDELIGAVAGRLGKEKKEE